jgi:hypothetical protein
MTDQVELDSLVGEHVLDAVDLSTQHIKQYGSHFENCEVIRFRLDGVAYTAIENPDDGYRSSMDSLFVSDEPMQNVFPPVRVIAKKKDNERYSINDTLQLVDAVTGLVVVEVGTDNTDDYYPCFVSYFAPHNMVTNEAAVSPSPQDSSGPQEN